MGKKHQNETEPIKRAHSLQTYIFRGTMKARIVVLLLLFCFYNLLVSMILRIVTVPGLRAHDVRETFHPEETSTANKKASLAFMFMSTGELYEDLWAKWFPATTDPRYSIFVHTKPLEVNETLPLGPFFRPFAIPSVASSWGDLYTAYMHILSTAAMSSPDATYFVLVSEASIPLVSFDELYQSVVQDQHRSRLCWSALEAAPQAWREVPRQVGLDFDHLRKGEMWSALSREHVELLLQHRTTLDTWNTALLQAPIPLAGVPDELVVPTFLHTHVPPGDFSTCTGAFGSPGMPTCCTHAVYFDKLGNSYARVWERHDVAKVPLTRVAPSGCMYWKGNPCSINSRLSEDGLRALREEGFWMFRKVFPNTTVIASSSNATLTLADAILQLTQGQARNTDATHRAMNVPMVN